MHNFELCINYIYVQYFIYTYIIICIYIYEDFYYMSYVPTMYPHLNSKLTSFFCFDLFQSFFIISVAIYMDIYMDTYISYIYEHRYFRTKFNTTIHTSTLFTLLN